MNAATPGDPDCSGIHWEEPDFFWFICRYNYMNTLLAAVTTSAGKKHTLDDISQVYRMFFWKFCH